MSIAIQWESGDGITLVPSGSYIGFYGSSFNQSIPLQNYNQTTVVTNQTGTVNNGSLPNAQYTTPGYGIFTNATHGVLSGSIKHLFADSGKDMTLHIRITSGSLVFLSNVNLIAYSGIDINQPPTNVTVVGFESGSMSWTTMKGLAEPLALTPHTVTASAVHDYYVSLAVTPQDRAALVTTQFAIEADWYR